MSRTTSFPVRLCLALRRHPPSAAPIAAEVRIGLSGSSKLKHNDVPIVGLSARQTQGRPAAGSVVRELPGVGRTGVGWSLWRSPDTVLLRSAGNWAHATVDAQVVGALTDSL